MSLTYGELFAGYGGMHLGLATVLPGELAWYSENAPAPSQVMAHHHPGAPNLGDVTAVDWASVPPVDVLTGGTPCQDLSAAGKRAGMRAGTRSGLWASMLTAIDTLRPSLVVWENVRGATSASAYSAMESCPGCLGDRPAKPAMRALGRVLGDLANIRYDAWWIGLRASDLGAAHSRFRIFLFATPAGHPTRLRMERVRAERLEIPPALARQGLPDSASARAVPLLPTPGAADRLMTHAHRNGAPTLSGAAIGYSQTTIDRHGRTAPDWATYSDAITRAELFAGRPAPHPVQPSPRGNTNLAPPFVEWLMGLPDGYVTQVAGVGHQVQLEMLGNGVVPQQVAAAARAWLADAGEAQ